MEALPPDTPVFTHPVPDHLYTGAGSEFPISTSFPSYGLNILLVASDTLENSGTFKLTDILIFSTSVLNAEKFLLILADSAPPVTVSLYILKICHIIIVLMFL